MRFFLSFLLTMALAFVLGLILPWWSIAVAGVGVALLVHQNLLTSFLAGFFGIFALWLAVAFWLDSRNESILSKKIATIFPLEGSGILLMLITAFVGALVGGFAAMIGSSLRGKR